MRWCWGSDRSLVDDRIGADDRYEPDVDDGGISDDHDWLEPDDAELEEPFDEEEAAATDAEPAADGVVMHPGLVPSLEARARSAAAGDGDTEGDEATADAL